MPTSDDKDGGGRFTRSNQKLIITPEHLFYRPHIPFLDKNETSVHRRRAFFFACKLHFGCGGVGATLAATEGSAQAQECSQP